MSPEELVEFLRSNLKLCITSASNDPEDDTRELYVFIGEEEITSVNLGSG